MTFNVPVESVDLIRILIGNVVINIFVEVCVLRRESIMRLAVVRFHLLA